MARPFRTFALVVVALIAVVVVIDLTADFLERYGTRTNTPADPSTFDPTKPEQRPARDPGRSLIRAVLDRL